jgi:hypothetical protein
LSARLGRIKTLAQGVENVADQFKWSAIQERAVSLYVVDCGLTFSLLAWVCEDDQDFAVVRSHGAHIHKPGDFLSYKQKNVIAPIGLSWVQSFD